jgi:hypothetical protein
VAFSTRPAQETMTSPLMGPVVLPVAGGFGPMVMSFREIFCQFSGKALDRKNLFSSLNAAVSKLSNLKRPVYGHTSSVPE